MVFEVYQEAQKEAGKDGSEAHAIKETRLALRMTACDVKGYIAEAKRIEKRRVAGPARAPIRPGEE